MYWVSNNFGSSIYGITDTTDNVEERYSSAQLRDLSNKGISIYGVDNNFKVRAYKSLQDIIDQYSLRCRLSGIETGSFSVVERGIRMTNGSSSRDEESVVVPDFVTSINFYNSHSLRTISISSSVQEFETGCFSYCSVLESIKVPNLVSELPKECFRSCLELQNVSLSDGLLKLGDLCFASCSKLKSIRLPDSVTSLGDSCFHSCIALGSIELPDSIRTLGDSCFKATGLTSIVIPDSITELPDMCFSSCYALKSVTIPESVIKIGKACFEVILYGGEKLSMFSSPINSVFNVKPNSYAEEYCKKNKISYRYY